MLIGLAGYARSGKDTLANILVEEHGFCRLAFADILKDVLQDLNPKITVRSGKRGPRLADHLDQGWDYAKKNPEVRELLQRLGVACREHIRDDVWVRATMRKVIERPEADWVISDVRFPNEAQTVRLNGGKVWRIERPGFGPVNGHISESALDGFTYDRVIPNNKDIAELAKFVKPMVPPKPKGPVAKLIVPAHA